MIPCQRPVNPRYKRILFAVAGIIIGGYFFFYYPEPFQKPAAPERAFISADDSTPNIVEGKVLYQQNCASCHGNQLEGEKNWRSRKEDGSLPAPPHNQDGHTWHHPDRLLFHITKFGGASVAPQGFKSNMPAFEDVLTDEEILATLEFIKSTWPKEIRQRQKNITDKDITALSQ